MSTQIKITTRDRNLGYGSSSKVRHDGALDAPAEQCTGSLAAMERAYEVDRGAQGGDADRRGNYAWWRADAFVGGRRVTSHRVAELVRELRQDGFALVTLEAE